MNTKAAMTMRAMSDADWPAVWPILHSAFAAGDSYPCPVDISEADARRYWLEPGLNMPKWTYVAENADGCIVGTFYLRADQGGPGDHVCNAGYVVAPSARGRGVAVAMGLWSKEEARRRGFSAMRFNLVVSTNRAALRAWTKCGMAIVGTVPGAFRLPDGRRVDAYIMHGALDAPATDQCAH